MKKYILPFIILLFVSLPSFGQWNLSGGNGTKTDSNCDQAAYYPIGTLCQDTDDGKLYKGTGAAVSEIAAGSSGDVAGPAASTAGEVVLFDGITGKIIKRSNTLSGFPQLTSGILSAKDAENTRTDLELGALSTVTPGANVATFLATPSTTNFFSALTGEGTGVETAFGNNINASGGFLTYGNAAVTASILTGYSSGAGTVAATDTILQAFNKLNGNDDLKLNIANSAMTGDATLTDATPTFICNDSTNAAGTCGFFANSSGGANDMIWSFGVEDSTGASTEYFQIDGVTETIDFLKPVTLPNAGVIRPAASTDGHTFIIQAYGTDGSNNPELKNVITCTNDTAATANNLPECSIDNVDLKIPVLAFDATPDGMADDKYNGQVIKGRNCGENLTQWDTVRLANDADPWHQADADAAGEFPAIGLVVAACTDGNPAIVLTNGIVRNEGWTGLTPGGKVYLSDSAGGITQTPPATSGDCVQVIGWALSDSEIYFDFSRPYLELE